jgi:FMN phosphatase YigB (HAD superfamily)
MESQKLKTILFDFDGVLSKGRFYSTIVESHPDIHAKIVQNIFTKEAWDTIQIWMRGEMSFEGLHKHFSDKIGAPVEFLNRALIDSILIMKLNEDLMLFNEEMRKKGVKTAVFTDNMDIFERLFVPYNNLSDKFDYIFSSSTHKKLKLDNEAEFLKEVLTATGNDPATTLFLDDSPKIGVYMEKFGGHFYCYDDYLGGFSKFRAWVMEKFDI